MWRQLPLHKFLRIWLDCLAWNERVIGGEGAFTPRALNAFSVAGWSFASSGSDGVLASFNLTWFPIIPLYCILLNRHLEKFLHIRGHRIDRNTTETLRFVAMFFPNRPCVRVTIKGFQHSDAWSSEFVPASILRPFLGSSTRKAGPSIWA